MCSPLDADNHDIFKGQENMVARIFSDDNDRPKMVVNNNWLPLT